MRRAVVDSDDDMRAAWSGALLLLLVAEPPRQDDPILALADDGAKKASVVLGRVASWRAAAVRNEAVLRLRPALGRDAGTTIIVLVLCRFMEVLLEAELFPSTEFLRSTDGEEAKRLDKMSWCVIGTNQGSSSYYVRT